MATSQGQDPEEDNVPPTIRLMRVEFPESMSPNVPHVYGETFVFPRSQRENIVILYNVSTKCFCSLQLSF